MARQVVTLRNLNDYSNLDGRFLCISIFKVHKTELYNPWN